MLHNVVSTIQERVAMLSKSTWGDGLSQEELEKFAQYLYVAKAAKEETIFNEGAIEPYMCFIADGLIKIAKGDSKKNIKTICEIGAGRTFGEMSIIDGLPRSASALAAEETTVLVLTKEKFESIVNDHPRLSASLYAKFAQMMSHRLRISDWMLVEYLYE